MDFVCKNIGLAFFCVSGVPLDMPEHAMAFALDARQHQQCASQLDPTGSTRPSAERWTRFCTWRGTQRLSGSTVCLSKGWVSIESHRRCPTDGFDNGGTRPPPETHVWRRLQLQFMCASGLSSDSADPSPCTTCTLSTHEASGGGGARTDAAEGLLVTHEASSIRLSPTATVECNVQRSPAMLWQTATPIVWVCQASALTSAADSVR